MRQKGYQKKAEDPIKKMKLQKLGIWYSKLIFLTNAN